MNWSFGPWLTEVMREFLGPENQLISSITIAEVTSLGSQEERNHVEHS